MAYRKIKNWLGQTSSYPYVIVAISLLLYLPSLGHRFVLYDDDLHLFRNPALTAPFLDAVEYFWNSSHKGFYIPVTYTIWAALVTIARPNDPNLSFDHLNPLPFHIANLFLHALNAWLLFQVLRRLVKSDKGAFWGGMLFAIHPFQVECVAWATGLKDLVATTFAFVSILFYFQFSSQEKRKWMYYGLGFFAYLLALLSKPGVLPLPLGLWIIDFYFLERPATKNLLPLAAWLILTAPLIVLTSSLQPLEFNMYAVPLWGRPFVALDAYFFYLWKLVIPYPLIHDYGRNPEWLLTSKTFLLTSACSLALAGFLIWKRKKAELALLALFTVLLAPVSGGLQFAFQNFSTVADHYIYFPFFAVSFALAFWIWRSPNLANRKLAGLFLVLFCLSFRQNLLWHDSERLLFHTIKHNPKSVLAHNNLGVYYEWVENWEGALNAYHSAEKAGPRFIHHYYNLGNIYMRLQKLPEAVHYLEATLALQPRYPEAHFNLGLIAEAAGDLSRAEQEFKMAMSQEPGMFSAHTKLAGILNRQGKWLEARERFEYALRLNPLSPQVHLHYARALEKRGYLAEAREHYAAVKQLQPMFDANKSPKRLIAK